MSCERFDIVISGGSFVGLALALAVARTMGPGLRVALVDRKGFGEAQPNDVRASALSAASKQLLDVLDVWPRVADEAQPVARIELTDSPLEAGVRPVLTTYRNELSDGEPASYILPNRALSAALLDVVSAESGVHLLAGKTVTGFAAKDSGAQVTLSGGAQLSASLAVAADGRRSPLREAAGLKVVGWSYGQTGIVTRVTHERPHHGVAMQHFLPGGPFAILPLPGNRSCITWSERTDAARRILALDDDGFLAEVELRFGGRLGRLSLDGPRQSWPLEMHLARRYVAPGLALVGDAAHGVHPIAGQGLNLALRDVAALVEVLSDAARLGLGFGDFMALERYERWRRFDSATSAATFDGLNRLFSSDWTLLRSARELGLTVVDRMPGLKRLLVREAAGLSGEVPKLLKGELPS